MQDATGQGILCGAIRNHWVVSLDLTMRENCETLMRNPLPALAQFIQCAITLTSLELDFTRISEDESFRDFSDFMRPCCRVQGLKRLKLEHMACDHRCLTTLLSNN